MRLIPLDPTADGKRVQAYARAAQAANGPAAIESAMGEPELGQRLVKSLPPDFFGETKPHHDLGIADIAERCRLYPASRDCVEICGVYNLK